MTADLLVFLRARYDEDEWKARAVKDAAAKRTHYKASLTASAEFDLADLDSKRRILDLHSVDHECSTIRRGIDCVGEPYEEINNCTWVVDEDCSTVRLLALPYADHPEFRPEWRP